MPADKLAVRVRSQIDAFDTTGHLLQAQNDFFAVFDDMKIWNETIFGADAES